MGEKASYLDRRGTSDEHWRGQHRMHLQRSSPWANLKVPGYRQKFGEKTGGNGDTAARIPHTTERGNNGVSDP